MSIRLAVPVVPSNRTHALLSYQGPVVNVDRGMTTGAAISARRETTLAAANEATTGVPLKHRGMTTGVPLKHRNVSLERAKGIVMIQPPVLSQEEFEMSEQVYATFDEYSDVTDLAGIIKLNEGRFGEYLKTTVAPLFPKKFKDEKKLLETFQKNIADMNFWNKKGVYTYKQVITTFRGPTFWLSNMFPTMIHYKSVKEMFDKDSGIKSQGMQIFRMNALMERRLRQTPKSMRLIDEINVRSLYALVQNQFFIDPSRRLFASPEHKFMASKVKVGSLLTDAVGQLASDTDLDGKKIQMANDGILLFERIRTMPTATKAKKLANNVEDKKTNTFPLSAYEKELLHSSGGPTSAWAQINQQIMARAIAKKFIAMPSLVGLLQKLKGYQIFEGNYFFDDLWGVKFDLIPWAPRTSNLVKDEDDKVRGVLYNTEGDSTLLEGMNWLGRCHMAVAAEPNAAALDENRLYALLMKAMAKAPPPPPSM